MMWMERSKHNEIKTMLLEEEGVRQRNKRTTISIFLFFFCFFFYHESLPCVIKTAQQKE